MNSIDETALINLVRNYPLLYDLSSPLYNDQQKKEEAWNEISNLTSASAYDCKTKWTRLRDNYRKALIVRSRNDRAKDRAVKYEKQLSFLNEKFTFAPKKRYVDLDPMSNEIVKSEEPQVKLQALQNLPVIPEPGIAPKKPVASKANTGHRPVHEMNAFFEGIAETVKTFPKKVQIQLKREVFNLVNDTEISLLGNDNENMMYYSLDSSMPGVSEFITNKITDSPSNSGSNEYFESPNHLQTSDGIPEQYCDVQIKEENTN